MSLLFDEPLIAGLRVPGGCDQRSRGAGDRSIASCRSSLRRSASTAGIGNRKTQSFGWRYDFDDASFTPDRADSRLAATAA